MYYGKKRCISARPLSACVILIGQPWHVSPLAVASKLEKCSKNERAQECVIEVGRWDCVCLFIWRRKKKRKTWAVVCLSAERLALKLAEEGIAIKWYPGCVLLPVVPIKKGNNIKCLTVPSENGSRENCACDLNDLFVKQKLRAVSSDYKYV